MATASAAGKTILLGEHAVVYNRPAIAVPICEVRATATVKATAWDSGIVIEAEDIGETYSLEEPGSSDTGRALTTTVRNTLHYLGIDACDATLRIVVRSQIPIARGMGSGAAVSTAIVRALYGHFGRYPDAGQVSDLVYQTEVIFHGTPSGIDNTVVAYEKPVYFCRERGAEPFWVGRPFSLLIADTGIPSRTRDAVQQVREGWSADTARYDTLFDQIGSLVDRAREAIQQGRIGALGQLMDENQQLLRELGVSSPELGWLVRVARDAGAKGAKLSGGGMGGCLIALVDEQSRDKVSAALLMKGATQVIPSVVG